MPTNYYYADNAGNLVSYSTYNASTWSNIFPANATLTTGISAPDGSANAIRLTCTATGSSLLRVTFPSFTANGTDTYTTSFYVRKISGTTSSGGQLTSDLTDGNPTGDYVPNLVTNTWVRVSFTGVPAAGAKSFLDLLSDNINDYVLDFWGVQIEKKSFLGTYIPTTGNVFPAGDGKRYAFDDVFVPADLFRQPALWLWGFNGGDLGVNDNSSRSTPVTTFLGGSNWKSVACGFSYTAAIKTDGTLWNWGRNFYGTLGINDTIFRNTPVTTILGGSNWKSVSASLDASGAIKTDGTLWIWGRNSYGQLGVNDTTPRSTPVTTILGGTNWKEVACGSNHTVAIKTDGTLWICGRNGQGQLGVNDIVDRSTPVTTLLGGINWKQVVYGIVHTAAIKTDGTLWTWGYNTNGQLGVNDLSTRNTPVTTILGGTNWKQVAGGSSYIAAIKTDGTLWTWAANNSAQLGVNDVTDRLTPVTTILGGTNWKSVGAGGGYCATAIKTDGTLWNWGRNDSGQLGVNDIANRSTPVTTILGGTNWKQVAGGVTHTTAIQYAPDP